MKYTKHISRKWRKLTAVLLLLNFFVAPMISAFPIEECDEACEMIIPHHDCNSDQMKAEDTCCDVMLNSNFSNTNTDSNSATECGMKISDVNCAIVTNVTVTTKYIIPKTADNKVEFVQFNTIDFKEDNSTLELLELTHEFSFRIVPHIYLTNLAFLI
jgi:hypothetical protein